jgi:hypothetical protein
MTAQELLAANGISLHSTAPGRYYTICPRCSHKRSKAHQKTRVLGITIEDDGGVRWGCNHCNWTGPEKGTGKSNGGLDPHDDRNFVATYDYIGFQKVRYPKGQQPPFRIRHREGNGWKWGAGDADTSVLYRKDEIEEAISLEHTILVVEGEKDVENCRARGLHATCNAHGASEPDKKPKWKPAHSEQLRGADIVVIPDHDTAGYAHAEAICRMSLGIAKRVRRLDLAKHWPKCPKGGDISDWLDAGHTREELDALIEQAEDYAQAPHTPSSPHSGWRFHDDKPSPPTPWLIKNLLPETGAGLLSGQWGTYKTTTALDLAVSVMAGPPFANRFIVKRRGGVAYFAVEGGGGLKSRLDAIAQERGVSGELPFAWRSDCPPLMASNALDQLTRMAEEASQEIKRRFGVSLVLIFIDTVIAAAAYANAGDDNDTAVSQKVMSVLSGLSQQTGALVIGVDHFGKVVEVGTRGSSNKEGHADVVLALLGDRQVNGTITNNRLALRKLRDGPSGLELPFAPKDVKIGTDPDGEEITRKVIDWDKQAASKPDDAGWSKSLQLLRRILMTMLADAGNDVMPFADGPIVRAVDLKLTRAEFYKQYPADGDTRQQTNVRRQAFNRAIKDAQAKALIVVREVGGVQLVWLAAKTEEPA